MNPRATLDLELSNLDAEILKLGSLCEIAIDKAMLSLQNRSSALANEVIVGDYQINDIRNQLEERCYRILATQHPTATDLRQVIAVMHIASELERIGDHASGIARLVDRMSQHGHIESLHQLPKMSDRARKMVRRSLQAFISRDPEKATAAIERDEKIDRQYVKFTQTMLAEMNQADAEFDITVPTYLLWMAHNIERIGDRVTNICERVIFMVTGVHHELDEA